MNLYLVKQNVNKGYDTFDSFVCAAPTEDEARHTHPYGGYVWDGTHWKYERADGLVMFDHTVWASLDHVTVEHIGVAKEDLAGIICASFNAG